jgi:hypothetical protein
MIHPVVHLPHALFPSAAPRSKYQPSPDLLGRRGGRHHTIAMHTLSKHPLRRRPTPQGESRRCKVTPRSLQSCRAQAERSQIDQRHCNRSIPGESPLQFLRRYHVLLRFKQATNPSRRAEVATSRRKCTMVMTALILMTTLLVEPHGGSRRWKQPAGTSMTRAVLYLWNVTAQLFEKIITKIHVIVVSPLAALVEVRSGHLWHDRAAVVITTLPTPAATQVTHPTRLSKRHGRRCQHEILLEAAQIEVHTLARSNTRLNMVPNTCGTHQMVIDEAQIQLIIATLPTHQGPAEKRPMLDFSCFDLGMTIFLRALGLLHF